MRPTGNSMRETIGLGVKEQKKIHDSVHGSITVKGVFLDLIQTAEFQRLHDIKQLGLAYLVFPGAHQTRLEHSLGTYHIARLMSSSLGLKEEVAETVMCAALLHDVGHAPFSHTLEWFLKDKFGFTHEELTANIITGKESILPEGDSGILGEAPSIPEVLERHSVDPREVAKIVVGNGPELHPEQALLSGRRKMRQGEMRYPYQMIRGPVDCDQIDYLIRDSHYTGVAFGVIDRDRLLSMLRIYNGDLVVESGGVPAVEGMLVARALMFTSVYFHKTVRIAELMLAKAAEKMGKKEIDAARKQNDSGFLAALRDQGELSRKLLTSLKYRRLYKTALVWKLSEMDEGQMELLKRLCSYGEKVAMEESIRRRAGLPPGSVVIDVPGEEIITSEPRLSSVNIGILEGNRVKPLSRVSPLASALQLRKVQDWALLVACPPTLRAEVKKAAVRVLSSG
jgi:HD superfamily phosphohydrolase